MNLNLPALEEALEDVEFFERDRTDAFVVELAIVLYNSGVSLRGSGESLDSASMDR